MNIKFYHIVISAILTWIGYEVYNQVSQENDAAINKQYDDNLSDLIEKFHNEGKDYETSYDLAVKCLKKRSEGIAKDKQNSSSPGFKEFYKLSKYT